MSFDWADIQDVVKETHEVQVWRFNVYVEVDDVYVDEWGDDDYHIDVDLRAYGSATVHDDIDARRLKDNLKDAVDMLVKEIDARLRRYHDQYGFGYHLDVKRVDTDDIDIDSY